MLAFLRLICDTKKPEFVYKILDEYLKSPNSIKAPNFMKRAFIESICNAFFSEEQNEFFSEERNKFFSKALMDYFNQIAVRSKRFRPSYLAILLNQVNIFEKYGIQIPPNYKMLLEGAELASIPGSVLRMIIDYFT